MFEFTIRENDFLNGFLNLLSDYVNKSYKFTMSYLTSPLLSDVRESERLVLLVVNKSVFQNMYSFIKLNDSNMQFASFSCLETAVNSMRLYNVLATNPDYMHEYITGGNFSLEVCENEISEKQKEYNKGEEEFSLREFATGLGMGGLGYLEVLEDGSYKGPIDKFIPDDCKEEFRTLAGLEVGDTIFFMADKEERAAYYAGLIRNELGEKLDLIEKNAYRFCYVNDFPMFEKDPETKKIGFTHNPFSMPQGGLEALNTMDPLDILAYQYDIVCNGVELSSGAVRNHDMQIMEKAFEIAGYDKEVLKNKFGALYTAFQYGAPPHAGMAPGVDRMIMLLRNEENIREVIAFPMNGNAQDLMCGAPNEVTEQQLREVHIKVRD